MTFSPAQQKMKLRTNTKTRFERVRIVEKNVPQEIRVVFQKPCELFEPESAERLMPCGMRYPEPFRVRPNFFIPILAVSSYVLPFFTLMLLGLYSSLLPGFTDLTRYAREHGLQFVFPTRFATAIGMLLCLVVPMSAGASLAYILSKTTNFGLKLKLLLWCVTMSVSIVVEVYFGAFLSGTR